MQRTQTAKRYTRRININKRRQVDQGLIAFLQPKLCKRCGRLLISEESRKIGYGPLCAQGSLATRRRVELEKAGQVDMFPIAKNKKS